MNRYKSIYKQEEQYKVQDLDDALRNLLRDNIPPWNLKKSTLKIFDDVLEYPVADDHDALYYLDNDTIDSNNINKNGLERANFFYTSTKEFYDDPT